MRQSSGMDWGGTGGLALGMVVLRLISNPVCLGRAARFSIRRAEGWGEEREHVTSLTRTLQIGDSSVSTMCVPR